MWALKRKRSSSVDSDYAEEAVFVANVDELALQGAEVLRCLKTAKWDSEESENESAGCEYFEEYGMLGDAAHLKKSIKGGRSTRNGHATRSYVWRGPCRGATTKNVDRVASATMQSKEVKEVDCELYRDHGTSDDDESCSASGHKQRDKEWAALTTWLRMNLHHPRTNKRQVLFVGVLCDETRNWQFKLNPALSWDDVSPETKLRLKNLPSETEAAFARKYPNRPTVEWVYKTQKYKPQGMPHSVTIPMADIINTLQDIYYENEQRSRDSPASAVTEY